MPAKKSEKITPKSSVAKRAVNQVKTAPQKIVEHALNTAITTVEKAAQTDVKRAAKRVEKTTRKLEKVQKIARVAQTEALRASNFSTDLDKLNHLENTKETKNKLNIKEKIKDIITPQKDVTFYYDYRQLLVLTALYALFSIFLYIVSLNLVNVNMYNNWLLFAFWFITWIFALAALASVVYVTTIPQPLAQINKDGIKIDHNERLKWSDIKLAEEKYTSFITRRPFIALHVKTEDLAKYNLTFMQKLCRNNIFTPFSIPMYAMRPEDAAEIRNIIKRHAKYQDNRN